MATTYIEGIAIRPGRTALQTAFDSISYITNPQKTRDGKWVTGYKCSPDSAHYEILMQHRLSEQITGRSVIQDYQGKKKSYMLMTMRQSFAPGEVNEKTAHELGCRLAEQFLGGKYQYVVATHINTRCIHNHIIFNIVGDDYKKFHQTKFTPKRLAECSDSLCDAYGLSVVVPSQSRSKRTYTNTKVTPFRTILKNDIDRCVQAAKSYEEFLTLLEQDYYVKSSGKYLTVRNRTNGQQRNIRVYTLGGDYKESSIKKRIVDEYGFAEIGSTSAIPQACQEETLIENISYSQRLRNIQSMFQASGVLSDYDVRNYGDIQQNIQSLYDFAAAAKNKIFQAESELDKAEQLLNAMNILEKYDDVAREYEQALLKDRFYQTHRNELDLYLNAEEILSGIPITTESKWDLEQSVKESRKELDDLQSKYFDLQDKLEQINSAKRVIDKVHREKGGYDYGR
ncbi:relaxase/mobilization nuclease domain-containing protein [Faecalispora sporosphaeroides]|uniref:relaxase/mobilization nuclease domain-containing protein n=1 Tax=Faecalispora sporosphaeroides TaxID=1549 RepID=UPI00037320F8|nr:relaxase/mobilization nuclease domain-containing protein [Faecalispora sporosphaeroides]